MTVLVSSTEPKLFHKLGMVTTVPEQLGVDFLIQSPNGFYGVQRKTVADFAQSLFDGRLSKGLLQMKQLYQGLIIMEGGLEWRADGTLLLNRNQKSPIRKKMVWSLMLSVWSSGIWLMPSESSTETFDLISILDMWCMKDEHKGIGTRPGPQSPWGKATNKDWAMWLLQGFEGVGPEIATRMVERFKGVPLSWDVGENELLSVPGIGKEKARRLMEALEHG